MKNIVNAYAYCECGRRSVYQTNTEEAAFDINCISCGCPVTVQWKCLIEDIIIISDMSNLHNLTRTQKSTSEKGEP